MSPFESEFPQQEIRRPARPSWNGLDQVYDSYSDMVFWVKTKSDETKPIAMRNLVPAFIGSDGMPERDRWFRLVGLLDVCVKAG